MHSLIGNCKTCGYSLIRLSEPRCPECGTPFDPNDPRTMYIHPSRLQNFLTKKTTPWTFLPAFLIAGLAAASLAAHNPELFSLLTVLTILATAATLYILMARSNFQTYLKRRQRELEAEAAKRNPLQ